MTETLDQKISAAAASAAVAKAISLASDSILDDLQYRVSQLESELVQIKEIGYRDPSTGDEFPVPDSLNGEIEVLESLITTLKNIIPAIESVDNEWTLKHQERQIILADLREQRISDRNRSLPAGLYISEAKKDMVSATIYRSAAQGIWLANERTIEPDQLPADLVPLRAVVN